MEEELKPAVAVKRILKSKTIWINVIALIAFSLEKKFGFPISEDLQMEALTMINIFLRFITHEKIVWGGENGDSEKTS